MHSYKGNIENNDLVLTHVQLPSMEDGAISNISLKNLSETFSVLASERGSTYINATLRRPRSGDSSVMISGVKVDDLFNEVSGYKRIETLKVGVPVDIVLDDIEQANDMAGSDSYINLALKTRQNHIVDLFDTLVVPEAVDYIEEKGAYRNIYLKADSHEQHRIPLHTETAKAELEALFKIPAP